VDKSWFKVDKLTFIVVFCGEFSVSDSLMSEPGAALSSTASHNVAAGLGSHAFEETVFTAALAFLGLVSLFRHI
jgi:hypothetical protein